MGSKYFEFLQGITSECPMTLGLYKMLSCIYLPETLESIRLCLRFINIPIPKIKKLE